MRQWRKRCAAILMSACLLCAASPAASASQQQTGRPLLSADTVIPSDEQLDILQNGGVINVTTAPRLSSSKTPLVKATSLPVSCDLRQTGGVTYVEDQIMSGPCWSFGATAVVESQQLSYDASANFSEKHLSYFAYGLPERYKANRYMADPSAGETVGEHIYGWGGHILTPVYTMADWTGPAKESDFPYGTFDMLDEADAFVSEQHLQNALLLPEIDKSASDYIAQNKTLIAQAKQMMLDYNCALSVSYASADMANDYNSKTFAWYNETVESVDHGVAVVGWDDNYPKSNFNHSETIQNNGAWLVKNSWGTDFGDNGYFWLSYEDKSVILEGCYLFEPTDNYDRLYSYDASVFGGAFVFDESGSVTMANTFIADSAEKLEAVSFYTSDINTSYTVKIYKGLSRTADDPTAGTLCAQTSGTMANWGYHTVSLPASVSLAAGERFSVVVSLTNPTNMYTTYMEAGFTEDPDSLTLCGRRESYLYQGGWQDIAGAALDLGDGLYLTLGNFSIKAFTSKESHVVFSHDSGTVPYGTKITLSAVGNPTIYYTTDGSDPASSSTRVRYTQPITVERDMTVKATVAGGAVTEKRYTQTKAELVSLLVKETGQSDRYLSLAPNTVTQVSASEITIVPIANGTITVDGQTVTGGAEKTVSLDSVKGGYAKTVTLTVERDGCAPTTYQLSWKTSGVNAPADMNGNWETDLSDALALYTYTAGMRSLSDEELQKGDVDGDGAVGLSDALWVYRFASGRVAA